MPPKYPLRINNTQNKELALLPSKTDPDIQRMQTAAVNLPSLESKERAILGAGAHTICLKEGMRTVLLIMGYSKAKNVFLLIESIGQLNQKLLKGFMMDVPQLCGTDQNVYALLDPLDNRSAHQRADLELGYMSSTTFNVIKNKNIVFKMPLYDGTLEFPKAIRYKENTIKDLERSLYKTLNILHMLGFTHNDINLKNIFYIGEYPNIKLYLGDFSAITKNNESVHVERSKQDFKSVEHVVQQLKNILEAKYTNSQPEKKLQFPSLEAHRRKKLGVSPIKASLIKDKEQSTENRNSKRTGRRLFKV